LLDTKDTELMDEIYVLIIDEKGLKNYLCGLITDKRYINV